MVVIGIRELLFLRLDLSMVVTRFHRLLVEAHASGELLLSPNLTLNSTHPEVPM